MLRRRRLVVLLSLSASAAAIAAACSFPDPTFTPDGAEGGQPDTNSNPGDTSVVGEAGADVDSALPPDVDPDGGSHEASDYDAMARVDAAVCSTTDDCDCDMDHHARKTGNAACVGDDAGTFDCDDSDPAIGPQSDFVASVTWFSQWAPAHDWNCDGVVVKQYAYNFNCGGLQLGGDCTAQSGFSDNPECGQAGTFVTCKAGILSCAVDDSKTVQKVQGCK